MKNKKRRRFQAAGLVISERASGRACICKLRAWRLRRRDDPAFRLGAPAFGDPDHSKCPEPIALDLEAMGKRVGVGSQARDSRHAPAVVADRIAEADAAAGILPGSAAVLAMVALEAADRVDLRIGHEGVSDDQLGALWTDELSPYRSRPDRAPHCCQGQSSHPEGLPRRRPG